MRKAFLWSSSLILVCALEGACVGQKNTSLEEQVEQQDMQLRQLQPAQADTWNQLQTMREEINELKGQLDDLKNVGGARALVNQVNKHDAALHQVENSMAMNFNLGDPLKPKVPSAQMMQPSPAQPQSQAPTGQTPSQGSGTAPLGSYGEPLVATAGTAPAGTTPAGVAPWGAPKAPQAAAPGVSAPPSDSTWGRETPQEKLEAPQKDLSLALYDAGLNAFNSRNYSEAQRSFSDFLKNYGSHNLVPDAHYYLAECYFQSNQFSEAALEYNDVITKYPKSSRTPGSYLKQAICFSKSGQKDAAKARMNELIKKFPGSPEAARAKNFLKTNT
ncbi:MAG: tol-pal system protein YbgF [Desulfovibrio sp.]|nr:tol-pal system protein YbgF [Desulfovibrio sp.]